MKINKLFTLLLFIVLFCCSCSTTSQFKSVATGNVDEYLKQSPQASDYPNAGASLLHSYAYIEFFKDGSSVERHLERYKIFNERGRKHVSKAISYREGYQKATILFANTIKADGQVVPLKSSDIYDASQYAGYDFYTDIKLKRFTMPAVEDGCVVEYASEVQNIKPVFGLDYSTIFICQNLYPMEEDILEIVLPAGKELNYKSYNTSLAPQIISEGDKKRYIFTNLKQKAIIPESRMPSLIDRETFPQIWIWTMKDWKSISAWYVKLVSEQMKADKELEGYTRQLIAGKRTREEKISAIFNFVSQNIRYIAVLLGPHTHKPHAAYEVFQKRYGDCKDKTVLLLTMLKIAGIEGLPALVPVYREYFDQNMPSLAAFNHVIAVVPDGDKYFWLDATNEVAAYNSVPFIRPTTVFLMNADGSYRFVQTPKSSDHKDYLKTNIAFWIDIDGNAAIDFQYEYFGLAAQSVRYAYKYLSPEQRKKSFEKRGIEVLRLDMGSFNDTQSPFTIRLRGNLKNMVQVIDKNTMILSNIIRLDTYRDITAATSRQYPIVLQPTLHSQETSRYIFPDGFRIKKLPQPFILEEPFNVRLEKYSMTGSTLEVFVENISRERKITRNEVDLFRKDALELQKHESALKNIIMERNE